VTKELIPVRQINALTRALDVATEPAEIVEIETKLEAIEKIMRRAGLYDTTEIRPVNEARMRAYWKLGRALAKVQRAKAGRRGKGNLSTGLTNFRTFLAQLNLTPQTAMIVQRIGTMPETLLEKVFAESRRRDVLTTIDELVICARPHWYQENRKRRHVDIATSAKQTIQNVGPFPLIYADPPWQFEIYSEMGADRTPDQHYPTLTDQEIIDFKIGGLTVSQIAHDHAALVLWCTSSNIHRALDVMDGWDFEFKSSAVWIKDRSGLGLVFRLPVVMALRNSTAFSSLVSRHISLSRDSRDNSAVICRSVRNSKNSCSCTRSVTISISSSYKSTPPWPSIRPMWVMLSFASAIALLRMSSDTCTSWIVFIHFRPTGFDASP